MSSAIITKIFQDTKKGHLKTSLNVHCNSLEVIVLMGKSYSMVCKRIHLHWNLSEKSFRKIKINGEFYLIPKEVRRYFRDQKEEINESSLEETVNNGAPVKEAIPSPDNGIGGIAPSIFYGEQGGS